MFGFIKMFIGLLARVVSVFSHTKCVSLSNQKGTTQPTIINLYPNEYTQGLHYYPLAANLDKCVGSCSTLNDLCNKVCVPNKTVFNIITGIKESKALTKHISCKCKCKFDCRKCNSNQK